MSAEIGRKAPVVYSKTRKCVQWQPFCYFVRTRMSILTKTVLSLD